MSGGGGFVQDVGIVTDSICCLPKELIEHYGISIVPIRLLVQGEVYRDTVDMPPSQAYEMFVQDRNVSILHPRLLRTISKFIMRRPTERGTYCVSPFRPG